MTLTLFALPKPFSGHIGTIQRNALQSWARLRPPCHVLLLGKERGLAGAARRIGATHLAAVARNAHGTPLLDSAFRAAEEASDGDRLCYVNADILLLSDFLPALERAWTAHPEALLVGHRWDLDVTEPLQFGDSWDAQLRTAVNEQGRLHPSTGIDLFAFPKGFWGTLPPFAVGRTVWDGWMIWYARRKGAPVIDLTPSASIVHQNHGYGDGGDAKRRIWEGPEAQRNQALAGGFGHVYNLDDATHELTPQGLRRRRSIHGLRRGIERAGEDHPRLRPFLRLGGRLLRRPR